MIKHEVHIKENNAILSGKPMLDHEIGKTILPGILEAASHLSSMRLEGKFGKQYSHQYYNDDLGRVVDRYLIQHYQTGNLAEDTNWRQISDLVGIMWNPTHYAAKIAELDQIEVGVDAWQWALDVINKKIGSVKLGDIYNELIGG